MLNRINSDNFEFPTALASHGAAIEIFVACYMGMGDILITEDGEIVFKYFATKHSTLPEQPLQ